MSPASRPPFVGGCPWCFLAWGLGGRLFFLGGSSFFFVFFLLFFLLGGGGGGYERKP